jgi:hypothetical protein
MAQSAVGLNLWGESPEGHPADSKPPQMSEGRDSVVPLRFQTAQSAVGLNLWGESPEGHPADSKPPQMSRGRWSVVSFRFVFFRFFWPRETAIPPEMWPRRTKESERSCRFIFSFPFSCPRTGFTTKTWGQKDNHHRNSRYSPGRIACTAGVP